MLFIVYDIIDNLVGKILSWGAMLVVYVGILVYGESVGFYVFMYVGAVVWFYDKVGNFIEWGGYEYIWDYMGCLIGVQVDG